ncbi:hypothetical protein N2152v2_010917 [Parachlorella kessleri]
MRCRDGKEEVAKLEGYKPKDRTHIDSLVNEIKVVLSKFGVESDSTLEATMAAKLASLKAKQFEQPAAANVGALGQDIAAHKSRTAPAQAQQGAKALAKQVAVVQQRPERVELRIDDMEERIVENESNISRLNKWLAKESGRVDAVQEKQKAQDRKIEEQVGDIAALKTYVMALETTNTAVACDYKKMRSRVMKLEADKAELMAENAVLKGRLVDNEVDAAANDKENTALVQEENAAAELEGALKPHETLEELAAILNKLGVGFDYANQLAAPGTNIRSDSLSSSRSLRPAF